MTTSARPPHRLPNRPPHRVEWHAHDPLRSADLNEWTAYEREMLTLHGRAAHVTCRAAPPRVAQGTVAGSSLDWFEGRLSLDAIVLVTGHAAFEATPAYFPTVSGFISPVSGVLGPWPSIAAAWRGGFHLRLGFAGRAGGGDAAALLGRVRPAIEQTMISWIAIEPEPALCSSSVRPLGVIP